MNTAEGKKKLDNIAYQTAGIAQKYNNNNRRLQYLQEQGLMSSLPLGINQTEVHRQLTTTSTAIFVPFTTQELFQDGEALYYGLNALSSNMIMVDRKKLKNPKGLYCKGTGITRKTQAGKPFAAQMDGHPQEKNRNISHPLMTYFIAGKFFQNLFEKGSEIPPFFLLLVEGSIQILGLSDYTLKTKKGAQKLLSEPHLTNYHHRKARLRKKQADL